MANRYIVDLAGTLKQNFRIGDFTAVRSDRQVNTISGQLAGGGTLDDDLNLGLADIISSDSAGDAVTVPVISWDSKGRLTAVALATITAAGIGAADISHTHAWADVTGTPTTIAGYGIADGVTTSDSRLTNSRAPNGSAGGDLTGSYPNPSLANTAATPGTYGDNQTIPILTVDAKGRITSISSTGVAGSVPAGNITTGDLAGSTYASPVIAAGAVGNSKLANSSITFTAGPGMVSAAVVSLGDTLSLEVAFGTSSSTACVGNDSRLSDSRAPSGSAGGVLAGTYPNPSFAAAVIVNADVSGSAAIAWSKISKSGAVASDVGAAATSHTHAWSDITSTPTTLSGYGISDGLSSSRQILTTNTSLTGGGDLTSDRTLALVNDSNAPGNLYFYSTTNVGVKGWHQITASTITFTPYGNIASTLMQDAIQELDDEKLGIADTAGDSDALGGVTPSAFFLTLVDDTSAGAFLTTLGAEIGVDVQAFSDNLDAIAGLSTSADKLAYFTDVGDAALTPFTSAARTVLDDTSIGAMRITLGLDIGADVQAWDATLDTWATVTPPSGAVVGTTDTQTLTNKRYTPRAVTLTDAATVTLDSDTTDIGILLTLSQDTTLPNPNGTPTQGQRIVFRIKSSSVRALAYGSRFRGTVANPLPAGTTGGNKTDYLPFIYNLTDTKWDYQPANSGF